MTLNAAPGTAFLFSDLRLKGGFNTRAIWIRAPNNLTLESSEIYGNEADVGGAAITVGASFGSKLEVRSSLIRDNHSTHYCGAIDWTGHASSGQGLLIEDTTFSNNASGLLGHGGALCVSGTASAVIRRATFSGNRSVNGRGGAVYYSAGGPEASLEVTNSTFDGNEAAGEGGAIFATRDPGLGPPPPSLSSIALLNVTVADSRAGASGGHAVYKASLNGFFDNCILARVTGVQGPTCAGDGVGDWAGSGNLWSDWSCPLQGLPASEAQLEPLAANGGPTSTRRPLPSSLVIDGGQDGLCPAADQRGAPRLECWIGAYENFGF